jgi:hypothetical protein
MLWVVNQKQLPLTPNRYEGRSFSITFPEKLVFEIVGKRGTMYDES